MKIIVICDCDDEFLDKIMKMTWKCSRIFSLFWFLKVRKWCFWNAKPSIPLCFHVLNIRLPFLLVGYTIHVLDFLQIILCPVLRVANEVLTQLTLVA